MGVPSRLARPVAMPRPRGPGGGAVPALPIGSGAGHARPGRTGKGAAPARRGGCGPRRLGLAGACRLGPVRQGAYRSGPARSGGGLSALTQPGGACRLGAVRLRSVGLAPAAGARRAGPGDCGLWLSSVGPCPVWPVLRGLCRSGSARRGPVGLSQSGRARRLVRPGKGPIGPGGPSAWSGSATGARVARRARPAWGPLRSGPAGAAETLPRVARGGRGGDPPGSEGLSRVPHRPAPVSDGVPPGSLPRSPSRRNTFASHSFTLRNTARTASRFRVQMLFASNR